jgi:hypothetical protein
MLPGAISGGKNDETGVAGGPRLFQEERITIATKFIKF